MPNRARPAFVLTLLLLLAAIDVSAQSTPGRPVTIPELLALNPPSDQLVQGGFNACIDAEGRRQSAALSGGQA